MTPSRVRPPGVAGAAPAVAPARDGQLPTLDLLRRMTDSHIVAHLVRSPATRAELAHATGLSKPTVSESVRRLGENGVVREGAVRTGGRGRAGTLVELDEDAGTGLAIHAGEGEVTTEVVDLRGEVRGRHTEPVSTPVTAAALGAALAHTARVARASAPGPVRVAAISVADPVDPHTGRVVDLPGSPFLVGDVDLPRLMSGLVRGPVAVDNDVNWSALAELELGAARGLSDIVQVHLGAGVGAAIVVDGRVVQGSRGTAGEIAQLPWAGHTTLVRRLADLGLAAPGEWRLDLERLRRVLDPAVVDPARDRFVDAIALAVAGVATVLDPQAVILGGPLADNAWLRTALAGRIAALCVLPVEIRHAEIPEAPLTGARSHAAAALRELLVG